MAVPKGLSKQQQLNWRRWIIAGKRGPLATALAKKGWKG